jgi:hypothetical protein
VYARIGLDSATFGARPFTRLKRLKNLTETGQVDEHLAWAL